MTEPVAALLFGALLLVLPISALAARRVPMRQLFLMALAWVAIFAVGTAIVTSLGLT